MGALFGLTVAFTLRSYLFPSRNSRVTFSPVLTAILMMLMTFEVEVNWNVVVSMLIYWRGRLVFAILVSLSWLSSVCTMPHVKGPTLMSC